MNVLYVYAVTRGETLPDTDGVDGTRRFFNVARDGVGAVYSLVDGAQFSQETIDSRARDVEWLGAIGYHHQEVVAALMKSTAVVPLRAFTLFSTPEALLAFLTESHDMLARSLERLDGKREWTVRVEFDADRWSEALVARVPALSSLRREIDTAAPGKAFLLRKKLDDEKKRASREAEESVVAEIEHLLIETLACETISETRIARDGAFPQINVLIDRDEDSRLDRLRDELAPKYAAEGVTLAVSGPWPPYTFTAAVAGNRESATREDG